MPNERTAPFGGYKQSGNGREWGKYGMEDFLEVKAIAVRRLVAPGSAFLPLAESLLR